MRLVVIFAWLALVCTYPQVRILRPNHGDVLTEEVVFEVEITGVELQQEQRAEVRVNGVKAFEVQGRMTSVVVPSFEPGYHEASAFLLDAEGETTGSTSPLVQFLYDPPDRYESLLRSIRSVRDQTYGDIEIIIVNDASTDQRYYRLMEDVILIHLPYNIGRPGLVRNVGVAASSGEYIAFLDDDDVWMPDKLEIQINAMNAHGVNMSCSDAMAGNGTFSADQQYEWWLRDLHGPYAVRNAMQAYVNFGGYVDANMAVAHGLCLHQLDCLPDVWDKSVVMRANFVITSSVIVKRETLMHAGPFNNKTLGEDHDLWKKLLRFSKCIFVRQPQVYWRVDGDDKLTKTWRGD